MRARRFQNGKNTNSRLPALRLTSRIRNETRMRKITMNSLSWCRSTTGRSTQSIWPPWTHTAFFKLGRKSQKCLKTTEMRRRAHSKHLTATSRQGQSENGLNVWMQPGLRAIASPNSTDFETWFICGLASVSWIQISGAQKASFWSSRTWQKASMMETIFEQRSST